MGEERALAFLGAFQNERGLLAHLLTICVISESSKSPFRKSFEISRHSISRRKRGPERRNGDLRGLFMPNKGIGKEGGEGVRSCVTISPFWGIWKVRSE